MGYAPHAVTIFAATTGFYALKKLDYFEGDKLSLHLSILLGIVVLGSSIRSEVIARPLVIIQRTIALLFGFYALAAYPSVSDYYLNSSSFARGLLVYGGPIAVVAAIASFWRPILVIVPVTIVAWKKHLLSRLFGFRLNSTDYYPVAELGTFIALAILAIVIVEYLQRSGRLRSDEVRTRWSVGDVTFMAAVALHLANYFWSMVEKTHLPGAGIFDWITQNETYNIMLATWSIGLGPLIGYDFASDFAAALDRGQIPMNVATFLVQAAALIALIRIRSAIWLTVFYDVMHFAIFLSTSILFWKWMTLNVGIILALRALGPDRKVPWQVSVISIGVIALSPIVFSVAMLGWFDSAAVNRPIIHAELRSGERVRVPTNYFLEGSAELAKSRIGQPFEGHFHEIGAFGKARLGLQQMKAAARCDLATEPPGNLAGSFARNPKLERFFIEHDRYMKNHANAEGQFAYNLFPHHNWSNPAFFREFAASDVRDIIAYDYVIESACLTLGDDGLIVEPRLRDSYRIPVGTEK